MLARAPSSICNKADDQTQVPVLNCNDYRVIDITRLGEMISENDQCNQVGKRKDSFIQHDYLLSRNLQAEYDMLRQAKDDQPTATDDEDLENKDAEMIAEAKLLRQHKGRLEARMHILEDHNRQLELQLQRLRQLLEQVSVISVTATATETATGAGQCHISHSYSYIG